MEEQQIGWIAAIIIGGIAGWLAEQFMKSQMGLVMNIVLGIIGAAVASWLFGFLGITLLRTRLLSLDGEPELTQDVVGLTGRLAAAELLGPQDPAHE